MATRFPKSSDIRYQLWCLAGKPGKTEGEWYSTCVEEMEALVKKAYPEQEVEELFYPTLDIPWQLALNGYMIGKIYNEGRMECPASE